MLAAILLNTISYYGFVTNYTGHVFSETTFHKQYDKKVYKYRVLGKYLFLEVYRILKNKHPEKENVHESSPLKQMDPSSSENFYRAYYLFNTACLALCAIVLVFLFENKAIDCSEKEKWLIIFILLAMISITQFVVVPYDVLSYFLLILSAYCTLMYFHKKASLWLLLSGVLIGIATLNRESAALSVSFIAALCWAKHGFNKHFFLPVGLMFIAFLIPYIGLRIYFGSAPLFSQPWVFLKSNFRDFPNQMGCLFWVILGGLAWAMAKEKIHRKTILVFHLFSLPYIFTCLVSGILFEMRLYIPLFIAAMIIAKINPLIFSKTNNFL